MRYESRPQAPPNTGIMPLQDFRALLAMRTAWKASNPWRPVDWAAVSRQQKGASDAMREAQRTQREGEMEVRRREAQGKSLRRAA